jgi:hypothetical protein
MKNQRYHQKSSKLFFTDTPDEDDGGLTKKIEGFDFVPDLHFNDCPLFDKCAALSLSASHQGNVT